MKSIPQFYKSLFMNVLVIIMIILIALFPRHLDIKVDHIGRISQEYNFRWGDYWANIKGFFSGLIEYKSLGITRYGLTVETEILTVMPRSLLVIAVAFLLSAFLGILKGMFDYRNAHRKRNLLGNGTTWLLQSIPDFLLILLLQWFILTYFPAVNYYNREGWDSFFLPSLLVAIYPTVYIARITSSALGTQDGKLYILFARAKGLPERIVFYKHIFRNCFGTILTHLHSLMLYILSNLLIIEYFIDYRGAVQRLFMAIDYSPSLGTGSNYEPGMVIGISICFMILLIFVQVISQIAKRYVEPTVREVE